MQPIAELKTSAVESISEGARAYVYSAGRLFSTHIEDSLCLEVAKRLAFVAAHLFIALTAFYAVEFVALPLGAFALGLMVQGSWQKVEMKTTPPKPSDSITPSEADTVQKGREQEAHDFATKIKGFTERYNALMPTGYDTKDAFVESIDQLVKDIATFHTKNDPLINEIDQNVDIPPEAKKRKEELHALITAIIDLKNACLSSIFKENIEKISPEASTPLQKIRRVDEDGRELEIFQVKADGNCFYYSLILGLNNEPNQISLTQEDLEKKVPQFRKAIADYIQTNYQKNEDLNRDFDRAIEDHKDAKKKEMFLSLLSLPGSFLWGDDCPTDKKNITALQDLQKKIEALDPFQTSFEAIKTLYVSFAEQFEGNFKEKVRQALTPYMEEDRALDSLTKEGYIEKIRENGFFASYVEAYAAAQVHNVRLVIQRKVNNTIQAEDNWGTFKAGAENSRRKINIIHNGNHFDFIRR